jgi:sugar phosphate isomerase/epimerase
MPTRVAVCSWSLGTRSPAALADALRGLQIHGVQLALVPQVEDPAAWGGAAAALAAAGIELVSGMLAMVGEDYSTLDSIARSGGVRPDATWPANLARATRVADAAARCGIDLVTFHAGFLPEPASPERRRMLDRIHLIADAFQARGIGLALETGQETAATLLGFLEELHRPQVGVNFDPANMILYGKGDPIQGLRALLPYVRQVHVKDAVPSNRPQEWGTEVPAGQGAVDWDRFFPLAETIDPPVTYVIEREAGAQRQADIAAARDLIMRSIGEAR